MEHVKLSEFTPDPKNANKGTERGRGILEKSLQELGAGRSILVDKHGTAIAGNKTLSVAIESGFEDAIVVETDGTRLVVVKRTDLDLSKDEKAKLLAVGDNRASEIGLEWDTDVLTELSQEVDLSGFFFPDELANLISTAEPPTAEEDEETTADLMEQADAGAIESRVSLGQIWQIGRHRICCGDSTDEGNVRKLLGDLTVECMVTDPPYGLDYSSKNEFLNKLDQGDRNQTPITNDAIEDYETFFKKFLSAIPFSEHNTCYIFMSDRVLHELRLAFEKTGFTAACPCYLVWLKNNHVLCRSDYSTKHELILYGWKKRHKFYGDFSTTVLEFDKPLSSKEHPTMKPVELIQKLLSDGSRSDAFVYEPFSGSGTAFIAAQQMEGDRTVYGFELSEAYCEVVLQRFSKFSGIEPVLVGRLD